MPLIVIPIIDVIVVFIVILWLLPTKLATQQLQVACLPKSAHAATQVQVSQRVTP
jgi:hypothetical protein